MARLIFQDGHLSGLLGFTPQGFVDAWAPLFFGAMVFGVAMDYTLFLLSAAKERYETHADPEHAMVGSVLSSRARGHVGGRGHDRRVPDLRPLRAARPEGDGGHPRRGRARSTLFVVRLVLLPVLLRLGHHHSWHLPRWMARLLPRIRFAH